MKRRPVVAGQFYQGSAAALREQVEQYVVAGAEKEKVIGVMSPHAGLMYSGHVAGAVYSSIRFPGTFIIMGPNHTGRGAPAAIMASGEWEIPTATFPIDGELARKIMRKLPGIADDPQAHAYEHSLEVQLPFIARFSDSVKIVPLTIMNLSREVCEVMGNTIAEAVRETDYDVVIVASTDMSHYVPQETAKRLDGLALQMALALDPAGLYDTVVEEQITMCGFVPATVMLYAARALGASGARLVKYATSGDVSGDYASVVGYAGVIVS
jgi:hypothetical protein